MPKKIAILTPTFSQYSGIDHVVRQQAEAYAKAGNDVTVITLEASFKPKNYRVVQLGIKQGALKQRLHRLLFFLDRRMNYYKKLKNYDVVISHLYPMNWLAYKARKHYQFTYIYHNHGVNVDGPHESVFQNVYMHLFQFFTNITLRNVDKAYSVSKYLQRDLLKRSGIKSTVVYNKIEAKRFNRKVSGKKVISKFKLKNKKVLLFVGRIAPHKNVHLLIDILKTVRQEIHNAVLLIVGKPTFDSYYKQLKQKAVKQVIFVGEVGDDDLPHYYAACDLYVTASYWEGFNLPAAEVQACGKKVVAFNIGSHPEVVKHGILIEKGDRKEFSKAVIKLLR